MHSFRTQRMLSELDPAKVPLDDRDVIASICRALDVLRRLRHLLPTRADDSLSMWEGFIRQDVSFLLAEMAEVDAVAEYREYAREPAAHVQRTRHAVTRLLEWVTRASALHEGPIERSLLNQMRDVLQQEFAHYHNLSGFRDDTSALAHAAESATPSDYLALNRATRLLSDYARALLPVSLNEKSDHRPHAALLLLFVQLLETTRHALNGIGERHLDFFYRRILRLAPRSARPDACRVTFRLAPGTAKLELPAGTIVVGRKDATGHVPRYATDDLLIVTRARIDALRMLIVERYPTRQLASAMSTVAPVAGFLALPSVNSADGRGRALQEPETGCPLFSAPALTAAERAAVRGNAGVIIASPALVLRDGERLLRVSLTLSVRDGSLAALLEAYRHAVCTSMGLSDSRVGETTAIRSAFTLAVTGPLGWVPLTWHAIDWSDDHPDVLTFVVQRSAADPPLCRPVAPMPDVPDSPWPALRIELNPDARLYGYSWFVQCAIEQVTVHTEVTGSRALVMEGVQGPVMPTAPFPLFGTFPTIGGALHFRCDDLRYRQLEMLRLRVRWANLFVAPDSFAEHYAPLGTGTQRAHFLVRFDAAAAGGWEPLLASTADATEPAARVSCFPAESGTDTPAAEAVWEIDVRGRALHHARLADPVTASSTWDFRMVLAAPDMAFGHELHTRLLTGFAARLAPWSRRRMRALMAHPAWAPVIAETMLDYRASRTFSPSAEPSPRDAIVDGAQEDQLWHIEPFGAWRPLRKGQPLALQLSRNGYLYVGLSSCEQGTELTMYFDIAEPHDEGWVDANGSGHTTPVSGDVRLRYMARGEFVEFAKEDVKADSTRGLRQSGILRVLLPDTMEMDAWGDATPRYWIEIAISDAPEAYGRLRSVFTNAVRATRRLAPTEHGATNMPPDTVSKLEIPDPRIALVSQPALSWGGTEAENSSVFRARVSERLRHRNRAVLPRDYESIVLDAFSEIGEVRCLPMPRASVVIVVVPVRTGEVERPIVVPSVCRAIAELLRAHAPAAVRRIHVRSPMYESLRVSTWITFEAGRQANGAAQARDAIRTFLAPWQRDVAQRIPIGTGEVDLQRLRDVLLMHQHDLGIRTLGDVTVTQFYRTLNADQRAASHTLLDSVRIGTDHQSSAPSGVGDGERSTFSRLRFRPRTPWSVLVPADDLPVLDPSNAPDGIGRMRIEATLEVPRRSGRRRTMVTEGVPAGIGNLAVGSVFLVPPGGRSPHDVLHDQAATP